MKNWNNIEKVEPPKSFGAGYEFMYEIKGKFGTALHHIIAIWDNTDWYFPHLEPLGYEMSGLKFFKTYRPKFWREFIAPNLAD